MTTNETIAKWLRIKKKIIKGEKFWVRDNGLIVWVLLDFLHDRNQQKWIEDELEKRGYSVLRSIGRCNAWVRIIYENLLEKYIDINKENEIPDLDQAFIEAIIELIKKEGIK